MGKMISISIVNSAARVKILVVVYNKARGYYLYKYNCGTVATAGRYCKVIQELEILRIRV